MCVDGRRVKLLRYNDPVLGPRKLPNFDNFAADKSTIDASDTFSVDTERNQVLLRSAADRASTVPLGQQLVYIVTSWD